MTEAIMKNRAKRHHLMLMKNGHWEYYLTDLNKVAVASGPMSLVQVALWLDDLDNGAIDNE